MEALEERVAWLEAQAGVMETLHRYGHAIDAGPHRARPQFPLELRHPIVVAVCIHFHRTVGAVGH